VHAHITTEGALRIKRKNHYEDQYCPYSAGVRSCGDWCPLFNETDKKVMGYGGVKLCNDTMIIVMDDRRP